MIVEIQGALYPEERALLEGRLLRNLGEFGADVRRVAASMKRSPDRQRVVTVLVVTRGFRCIVETSTAKTLAGAVDKSVKQARSAVARTLGIAQPKRHTVRHAVRESMVVLATAPSGFVEHDEDVLSA